MNKHKLFSEVDLIGFPDTNRCIAGVYSFGDAYVGASKNLRKRILAHLQNYQSGRDLNPAIKLYLDNCKNNGTRPKVYFKGSAPEDELFISESVGCEVSKRARFYHQNFSTK